MHKIVIHKDRMRGMSESGGRRGAFFLHHNFIIHYESVCALKTEIRISVFI